MLAMEQVSKGLRLARSEDYTCSEVLNKPENHKEAKEKPMLLKNDAKEFEMPPEELYVAALVGIFDLGTQPTRMWGDKDQLHLRFEIEYDSESGESKRYCIGQTYTKSLFKKASLYKVLEALRGKPFTEEDIKAGFDPFTLLGKCCQLQVKHSDPTADGKVYANVNSVIKVGRGQSLKPSVQLLKFDFETDGKVIPEGTPKHIAAWIQKSKNWSDEQVESEPEEEQEEAEQIPF